MLFSSDDRSLTVAAQKGYRPATWVTLQTGDIGNTNPHWQQAAFSCTSIMTNGARKQGYAAPRTTPLLAPRRSQRKRPQKRKRQLHEQITSTSSSCHRRAFAPQSVSDVPVCTRRNVEQFNRLKNCVERGEPSRK